ncbi:MAG: 3-oxoacyl-ACP reductase FabG [Chloroflexi bacterium]|nr:3-oxoacyl-ACP reductase FabG [Chloroflexota bacterium]
MNNQTLTEVFSLNGRSALVTGGGTGIGKSIALRLAEAGASITIADVNLEIALQTVAEIHNIGSKAQAIQADADSPDDARKAAKVAIRAFKGIDILVNNAAVYPPSQLVDMPRDTWDKVLNTNLRGVFTTSQAVAQQMIKQGQGGKIINIASVEGLHPAPFLGHYDASKAGVIMLTKSMALEWAPHGILVNAIAPGGIDTPGLSDLLGFFTPPDGNIDDTRRYHVSRTPLGRMGTPDDIAKVAVFLASSAADYMTGSLVVVDGGFLLS